LRVEVPAAVISPSPSPELLLQPEPEPEPEPEHEYTDPPQHNACADPTVSLIVSAAIGDLTEVRWLLQAGEANISGVGSADVSLRSSHVEIGMTALHSAARYGHTTVVSLLLEAGADWRQLDDRGWIAMDWAREAGADDAGAVLGAWAASAELREEMERHRVV
jgi:hypothetical protein